MALSSPSQSCHSSLESSRHPRLVDDSSLVFLTPLLLICVFLNITQHFLLAFFPFIQMVLSRCLLKPAFLPCPPTLGFSNPAARKRALLIHRLRLCRVAFWKRTTVWFPTLADEHQGRSQIGAITNSAVTKVQDSLGT